MHCAGIDPRLSGKRRKKEPSANLIGAGRAWVEGPPSDPGGLESDLAAFGIESKAAIRQLTREERTYPVLPENWEALQIFLQCETQWRYAGMTAVQVGLEYTAVDVVMRMNGVEEPAETFSKLQLIECGALRALADKRDQE